MEYQENELLTLLIAVGVLIFIVSNGASLRELPRSRFFVSAYAILVAGWTLTVLEGIFWKAQFNFLEHACYATSSVLLALWCWQVFRGKQPS